MTIASAIQTKQQQVVAAYTAVTTKGGTLPQAQSLTNLATAIASIPSGGSTPSGTTDVTLTRFSDDNGTEIGTHYCNFADGNGNVYKVILLDAQYRLASSKWTSSTLGVTNMPLYSNLKTSNVWGATETGTENTQLILDYCASNSTTSSSCTHCRSLSFTIDGVTYYGQLPNYMETLYLAKHYNEFDALDTSASTSTTTNFSATHFIWSSTQYEGDLAWCITTAGNVGGRSKDEERFTCPVLEIPLVTNN